MMPPSLAILDTLGEYLGELGVDIPYDRGILTGWLQQVSGELSVYVDMLGIPDSPIASAHVLLLAAGVVIFSGVAGEAFFKKTGIPDVAFLMVLGVILGPLLGIVRTEAVLEIVPYFAALALIIIMFDGGLSLDIRRIASTAHFATALVVGGFVVSVAIVAAGAHFIMDWPWLESILLGSIVGGSSSAIVFGLVRNIGISEDAKSVLSFESALTDILATIVAFVMLEAVLVGHLDVDTLGQTLGRAVAVGMILGFGVGIPWLYVTTRLGNAQHAYMLTLGMLFVLFFLAQNFGESGALTALVFGLMLGNRRRISGWLRLRLRDIDSDDPTHNQLTFLVRSFFFVFVGLMATLGRVEYIIFGVLITVAVYYGRALIVKMSLTKRFTALDKKVTRAMIPRGLAAAVLATFPITMGLDNAEAYLQIIFFIIMASVVITTMGTGRSKSSAEGERDPRMWRGWE
ncbi:MAG: cation:proton antiporter [Nitrosopumilaceae archaeon]|nr:cation:proton antiporter [Nitrosopumilaceae archaeon]